MLTTQNHSTKTIRKLPVFEDDKDLLTFLERSLTDNLKQFIRHSISTLVKAEMQQIRAELQGMAFNGYYHRQLVSPFGKIEDVPIPRFRDGFGDHPPSVLTGFEDEKSRTWKLLHDMHLLGISQRKVKHLAKKHLGLTISPGAVKNAMHELVMHESTQINQKLLDDDYQYLFCDGIWEKIKGQGWDNTKAVVLCILGIKRDGSRELVGFTLARAEDESSWIQLLESIKQRGLTGKTLDLVVMDDSAGCKAAIERIFPRIPVQNCLVHKLRSVQSKTSYRAKAPLSSKPQTEEGRALVRANLRLHFHPQTYP